MKKRIPFHRPAIDKSDITAVTTEMREGWLTMGPRTHEFEKAFARRISASHAVAVSSCTAALHLSLSVIGLQPGDEVIVPDMTFTATGEVVTYFGARPVLVDVEPITLTLDPHRFERAITSNTKAVIPVHYAGQPCNMERIMDVAKANHLPVIEDAAHALPALYKGKTIGTIGDLTAFSFYATKTLTTGEGGMITTENEMWAERLKRLRLHGISKDAWKRYSRQGSWYYEVEEAGYKYNMTDLQAAMGLSQLNKMDKLCEKRAAVARIYTEAFTDSEVITPPTILRDRKTSWHLYVIRLNLDRLTLDRNRFIAELDKRGIGTSVHFIPLHRHPYYAKSFNLASADYPVSEEEYHRIISLPIYPDMCREDAEWVAQNCLDVSEMFRK